MSSAIAVALTVAAKRKILKRLVEAYTEELMKMIAEAEYKSLAPEHQIQTQSELSHWYQRWFHMVPDPEKSSVDNEDSVVIDSSDLPVASFNPNTNTVSYWMGLLNPDQSQSYSSLYK